MPQLERESAAQGDVPPAAGTAPDGGRGAGERPPTLAPPWWRAHGGLLGGGIVLALLAVPLAIALGVLHSPRWYPLLDLAQAEMRVRDVASSHPPLVGAAGRIEALGVRGSHPGPLSWYILWPLYALGGSTAWALQAATAASHLVAAGLTLWLAHRRGGARSLVVFGAALAVLGHVYGPAQLTEAWNPYLPLLWWFTFLVAAWSVLCRDLVALPVVVLAGSICTQAHISYLGLVGGVAGLLAVAGATWAWRHRDDRAALVGPARWTAASVALALVLWAPPAIEQLTNDPGNARIVVDHLRYPDEDPIGTSRGLELLAVHLDPWRLVAGRQATTGAVAPGIVLVAAWAAAAVLALRLGHRRLVALHALVGAVLVLSAVSVSRIFGEVLPYLVLWAWGTTALALVAIGWTIAAAVARRTAARGARPRDRYLSVAWTSAPALVAVVWTALFAADATSVEVPAARQSRIVAQLAPETVRALESSPPPGTGPDGRQGRYLVTWQDPVALGSAAQGVMLELERQGFDARALPENDVAVRDHRVAQPAEVDAEVHVAVGADVERWRRRAGAREVAHVDPRSPGERARYDELHERLVDGAAEMGIDAGEIDDRVAIIAFTAESDRTKAIAAEMAHLGQPAAVFIAPAG